MVVACSLLGCGDLKTQFLDTRVEDKCDITWPVCDTIAGCLLGDSSYIQGKFPGSGRIATTLAEPSTVTVWFYLDQVTGAGEETAISFFEDRCRSRVRQTITGKAFIGEQEQAGFVKRSQDLQGVGDHLIEFESDARLSYAMKLDVVPVRLKDKQ